LFSSRLRTPCGQLVQLCLHYLVNQQDPIRLVSDRAGTSSREEIGATALQRLPTWIADPVDAFIRRKTVGDLAPHGLDLPGEGTFSAFRRDDAQPTIVDLDVVEAIKGGRIEIVAGVSSVGADGVRLDDGTMLSPDTIIAATGFRTGLQPLVGHLDVLDDEGMPHGSGASAVAAGLHFLGYEPGVGVIGPRARRATRDLCQQLVAARVKPANPSSRTDRALRVHRNESRGTGPTGRDCAPV